MKGILLLVLLIPIVVFSQSQQRTITGSVKDLATKQPVGYCSLIQQNANNGTVSNGKGNFKIDFAPNENNVVLVLQALGYEADTLQINSDQDHYTVLLKPRSVKLEEIVVTGTTRAALLRENPVSITLVAAKQIERAAAGNIIDVLVKNVPGLKAVKTGPNISKPFIHGLGYNRVLTLYDGVRQEGQQYGDEHGIEVDDYNIEKAEVIKGPASVLYGSDAIAGVISLFPHIPKQEDGSLHGKFTSEYQTNNNLTGDGMQLDYAGKHFCLL